MKIGGAKFVLLQSGRVKEETKRRPEEKGDQAEEEEEGRQVFTVFKWVSSCICNLKQQASCNTAGDTHIHNRKYIEGPHMHMHMHRVRHTHTHRETLNA